MKKEDPNKKEDFDSFFIKTVKESTEFLRNLRKGLRDRYPKLLK